MFSQAVIEQLEYYVYFLVDPRDTKVFYVGKGKGNRIFSHLNGISEPDCGNEKIETIKAIVNSGNKVAHFVLRHGLAENEAIEVEAALIDFIGVDNICNLQSGHDSSEFGIMTTGEISAMYDSEEFCTNEPVILININRRYRRNITKDDLYESTRKAWVLGKRRNGAKYAIATYRGLTREVYLIEEWYPIEKRWAFRGKIVEDHIRKKMIYKSIGSLIRRGAANPIRYINC